MRDLAASTRFHDVRELAEVDSTNRYLLDLARAGAPEGTVVVADHQTAGRGRLGRTWEAPPGSGLLVSVLLRPSLAPQRRWLVTAAVALAAADACQAAAGGPRPAIKWPNDLLVEDRKVAGILAESDAGAVVVGVGINVTWAPPGAAMLGPSVDRGQLLVRLLTNLESWCERWDDVAQTYRRRCATVGRDVRVQLPDATIVTGRAVAVEPDGRLRVAVADRPEDLVLSAGDVAHIRTAQKATEP